MSHPLCRSIKWACGTGAFWMTRSRPIDGGREPSQEMKTRIARTSVNFGWRLGECCMPRRAGRGCVGTERTANPILEAGQRLFS